MLIQQICGALGVIGALLMLGSIVAGITSQSRYTDDSCSVVLTVGFAMFVIFGGLGLAIKYGGA